MTTALWSGSRGLHNVSRIHCQQSLNAVSSSSASSLDPFFTQCVLNFFTRYAIIPDGQTSFSELVWFRIPAKQSKLEEQWKEAHWVGKSERSDEPLLVFRGSTCSARAIRRKPREEQWNLDSVKEVVVHPWELRVRTEFDTPAVRQKYITNQALNKHGRTPHCTRCALGTGAHTSECRARFEAMWTKELAEAQVANRAADSISMGSRRERK